MMNEYLSAFWGDFLSYFHENAGSIFLRFGELGVIYVFQAQFLFSFWFLFSHQTCCLKSSVKAQLSQKSNTLLVPAHWAWLWSPVLCTESFCKPLCSPRQPQFLNFMLFVTWPLSCLFFFFSFSFSLWGYPGADLPAFWLSMNVHERFPEQSDTKALNI